MSKISIKDLLQYPPPDKIQWKKWSLKLDEKDLKVIALFKKQIKNELKEYDIQTEIFIQPVPLDDIPWGDYSSSLLTEKYGRFDFEPENIVFEPRLIITKFKEEKPEYGGFYPILSKGIYLQHNLKSKISREIVFQILSKYFKIIWNKSDNKSINILDVL